MAHPAVRDPEGEPVHVAIRAYAQAARVADAALPPAQASILLHERLRLELTAARAAYDARRLDQMCRHIERCQTVLISLADGVTLKRGAAAPLILRNFYLHLFRRLRVAHRAKDAPAAFDELISLVSRFCAKLRSAAH